MRLPRDDPHVLELLVVIVHYDSSVVMVVMKTIKMVVMVVEARKVMVKVAVVMMRMTKPMMEEKCENIKQGKNGRVVMVL